MGNTPGQVVPRQNLDIKNLDSETHRVKVSKTLGEGQDGWFDIPSGATERWKRHVGYGVTIVVSRLGSEQSYTHTMGVSAHDNDYNINGGDLERAGP
jgi:hypothetical protein